jgi:hypothetical protein
MHWSFSWINAFLLSGMQINAPMSCFLLFCFTSKQPVFIFHFSLYFQGFSVVFRFLCKFYIEFFHFSLYNIVCNLMITDNTL